MVPLRKESQRRVSIPTLESRYFCQTALLILINIVERLILDGRDPRPDVSSKEMILEYDQLFHNNYFRNERRIDYQLPMTNQPPLDSQHTFYIEPAFGNNVQFGDNLLVPTQQDLTVPVSSSSCLPTALAGHLIVGPDDKIVSDLIYRGDFDNFWVSLSNTQYRTFPQDQSGLGLLKIKLPMVGLPPYLHLNRS